jgi:dUTP pyrophosphatase
MSAGAEDGAPLRVRLVRVRPHAVLPERAYEHDAAFDLSAAEPAVLEPGGRATVPTGVAIELPERSCALVLPRSGLAARHGITLLNAPGLIDAGYRGELQAVLHNTDREPFAVEQGMRIAQLLILPLAPVELELVDALAGSQRGTRGFGSSGLAGRPA